MAEAGPGHEVGLIVDAVRNLGVEHARQTGYPILPCNLCGSQEGLRREKMAALLDSRFGKADRHAR